MLNYYIDLGLTDAQSATGINAGQLNNPFNFKQVVTNLNIGYSDDITFNMKGSKYISNFSAYSPLSNDSLVVQGSSGLTYSFVPWDIGVYGPWMLKINSGFQINNGPKMKFQQGVLEVNYLDLNEMTSGNPFFNNDYNTTFLSMYIKAFGKTSNPKSTIRVGEGFDYRVNFYGSTIVIPSGYGFEIGTDQRLNFENCIFDVQNVYSQNPGIQTTWFYFDNTCLTTSISALSASNLLSGGNQTGILDFKINYVTQNKNISSSTWPTFMSISGSSTSAALVLTNQETYNYLKSNFLHLLSGVYVQESQSLPSFIYDNFSDSAFDPYWSSTFKSSSQFVNTVSQSVPFDNFTSLIFLQNATNIPLLTSAYFLSGDFIVEYEMRFDDNEPDYLYMRLCDAYNATNSIAAFGWSRISIPESAIYDKQIFFNNNKSYYDFTIYSKLKFRLTRSSNVISFEYNKNNVWYSLGTPISYSGILYPFIKSSTDPLTTNVRPFVDYISLQGATGLPYELYLDNLSIGSVQKAQQHNYNTLGLWSNYRDGVGALYFERPLLELSANPTEGNVPLIVNFSLPSTSANLVIEKTIRSGITNQTMAVGELSADYTYNLAGIFSPVVSAQSYLRWNNEISDALTINTSGAVPASATFVMIDYIDELVVTSAHVGDLLLFSATSQTVVSRFKWDFDDSTSIFSATGLVQNVLHHYSNSGTYYPKLSVFNAFDQESIVSATLSIENPTSESIMGIFVDINNAYDFSGIDVIHGGTSADPLNWRNFIDQIKVDGTGKNNDVYRLKGTRRLYTNASSINSDPIKSFIFDTWASYNMVFSGYGPWMIITESSAGSNTDMPNLNFQNDILRNGIIYNKPVRIDNVDYAGRLQISEIYDMFINVMGKPYQISGTGLTLTPKLLQDGVVYGVWNKMASSNIPGARGTNYLIVSQDGNYVYGTMDPYYLVRYPISAAPGGQWEIVSSAAELGSNNNLFRMVEDTSSRIFIGAGNSTSVSDPARILMWDGLNPSNHLITVMKATGEQAIYSVAYTHIGIVGGSVPNGRLYWFNEGDTPICVKIAEKYSNESEIHDLQYQDANRIFGSTAYGGKLLFLETSAEPLYWVSAFGGYVQDNASNSSPGGPPRDYWSIDFKNNFSATSAIDIGEGASILYGWRSDNASTWTNFLSAGTIVSGDIVFYATFYFTQQKGSNAIEDSAMISFNEPNTNYPRCKIGWNALTQSLEFSDGQYITESYPMAYPEPSAGPVSNSTGYITIFLNRSDGFVRAYIVSGYYYDDEGNVNSTSDWIYFQNTYNMAQYIDGVTVNVTKCRSNVMLNNIYFRSEYGLSAYGSDYGEIVLLPISTYWQEVAGTVSAQEIVYDIIEHNGKIYGGSTSQYSNPAGGGKLLEWNPNTSAWDVQANTYSNYYSIPALASINEDGIQKLFAATRAWGQQPTSSTIQSFATISEDFRTKSVGTYPQENWNTNFKTYPYQRYVIVDISGTNAAISETGNSQYFELLPDGVFLGGDFDIEFGIKLSAYHVMWNWPIFVIKDTIDQSYMYTMLGYNGYYNNLHWSDGRIGMQEDHTPYWNFDSYGTWRFKCTRVGKSITAKYDIGAGWVDFTDVHTYISAYDVTIQLPYGGVGIGGNTFGFTYINVSADKISDNFPYIHYNKGFWNTPRTIGASVGAWAFTDVIYTGSGGDGGALLEWQPTISAWSQRLAKYNNISSLAGLTTLSAEQHLYAVAVSGSTNDLLLLDLVTTHKLVNIVGSTIKVDNGVYDNETDDYQIRIIDSVLAGFSASPGYLSQASYDIKNVSMDVKTTTFIQSEPDASLINNQYNWVPPTNYPFTRDNIGYNQDTDWLNTGDNKYYVKPFDGLNTPAEPGWYFSAYTDEYGQTYQTGLFSEQRTGIGAFYFGPRNSTISAGPFILNIYSNVAGAIVVESTSAYIDVSPLTIRLGLVYGQVINTTSDYEVDFVGVPIKGTSPLAVEFTDLTVVNQIGYEVKTRTWNFGDGTPVVTTDKQKIVHVYSGYYGQKFDVSLTVTVGAI